jgi:hypothetical protein
MDNLEVTRLEGEPIIITRAKGHITVELILEIYRQSDILRKDMPKKIYRISNYTQADTSFFEMMQILQKAMQQGSQTLDPNIKVVFVSTSHWAKLAADTLRQDMFRGREFPIFTSEEDALAYIRADMAAEEAQS